MLDEFCYGVGGGDHADLREDILSWSRGQVMNIGDKTLSAEEAR